MSNKYKNSRDVPTESLIARLAELSDAVTGRRDSQEREFTMRIPAECDRDADLVLAESARRLAAAKARIAELEEALEPFAREAKEWNEKVKDGDTPLICWNASEPLGESKFTVGDLRRAAVLLKEDKK